MSLNLRNIAIIAHVDHGKTTLVDALIRQSGNFRDGQFGADLILDNNALERERGITILAKNVSVRYKDTKINIIDTPGHADFGGEVERVLRMADGVLLLVDSSEGPMPQTRFVLRKAFEHHLRPIVVINKVDRPDARIDAVHNEVLDLFIELGADDAALEFPTIYASGKKGFARNNLTDTNEDVRPLFEAILKHIPAPRLSVEAPTKMLVVNIDYSDYLGRIGIGRIFAGQVKKGGALVAIDRTGKSRNVRVQELFVFEGLGRVKTDLAVTGDICAVTGMEDISIGETLADQADPTPLTPVAVDEPTLSMTFQANDSPLSGRDGKYVTSRHIMDRLERELRSNLAMRVEFSTDNVYSVHGRGLLHLGILIENMRREGYELAVGKPQVVYKEIDGKKSEPLELLVVDVPEKVVSPVMELTGNRRGRLTRMDTKGELNHLEFEIPARSLIGFKTRLMNATQGLAIMHHSYLRYEPVVTGVPGRKNGVMIAKLPGKTTRYAIERLQDRGTFFVQAGDEVYEGMVIGEHCKEDDIVVNITEEKRLTNMRVSSAEATVVLKESRKLDKVEDALEYIEEDELVEITPTTIRIRKRLLTENERKRASRSKPA